MHKQFLSFIFFFFILFNSFFSQTSDDKEYYRRGLENIEDSRYEEALLNFTKAIKLNESNELYYAKSGLCRYMLYDFDYAINDFDKAISLNPNVASFYFERAQARNFNYEPPSWSLEDYNKAIELDDTVAYYYSSRAFCKYQTTSTEKNYPDYIEDCNRAIKLDSTEASYYHLRGIFYGMAEDSSQAVIEYTKAISLDSLQVTQAFYLRGITRLGLKDSAGCIDLLQAKLLGESIAGIDLRKYCSNISFEEVRKLDTYRSKKEKDILFTQLDTVLATKYFYQGNFVKLENIRKSIYSLGIDICRVREVELNIKIDYLGRTLECKVLSGTFNSILDSSILAIVNNYEGDWTPYNMGGESSILDSSILALANNFKGDWILSRIGGVNIGLEKRFVFGRFKREIKERYFPHRINRNPLNLHRVNGSIKPHNYIYKEECENNEYYYRKGVEEFTNKRFKLAKYNFLKALNENPYDMDSQYNLGMSYLRLERNEKACECFKKCASLGDLHALKMMEKSCN